MAVSERFGRALARLLSVFRSYHDTPRTPDTVPDLASRRLELESARSEVAAQREVDGLTTAVPRRSPRWVDPSVGARPAKPFEIGAVLISIAIILGAALWFLWHFFVSQSDPPITLVDGSVVETLEETGSGACTWTVEFVLSTEGADPAWVTDAHIDRVAPVRLRTSDSLVPTGLVSGTAPGRLVHGFAVCPESIDDIDHGRLVVEYDHRGTQTRVARFGW